METVVYIATSLDGFVAREDGALDWLMDPDYAIEGEDYGFNQVFESVSCLVMDQVTFENICQFEEWPCGDKRLIVMSKALTDLPEGLPDTVELYSGKPAALLNKLRKEGEKQVYLDGAALIHTFLKEGLVNRLILNRIPVLIGSGETLFGELKQDQKFIHKHTKAYASGLVQSEFLKH